MRKAIRVLAVGCISLFASVAMVAQVATGAYPYGTFDNPGPETINVGNLNVHLSVPVLHKAGRGLPFTYDLSFDNSIWYPLTSNGTTSWTPVQNFGWRGATEIATGYVSYNQSVISKTSRTCWYQWITYSGFTYHDPFGAQHPIVGYTRQISGTCGGTSTTSLTRQTTDGSGYTISVTNYDTVAVSAPKGGLFYPPTQSASGAASTVDANGNEITADGSGHFTDTTGNVALTVAGSAGGSSWTQTFTYKDTNGNPQAVKVNYTQQTVATNFGCAQITEFPPTAEYLVSSIVLADGSSTYSFVYERNSNGYYTGRLSTVTLPQGGVITYSYPGPNGGINCSDGSTQALTRQFSADSGSAASTWTYTRTQPNGANTSHTELVDGLSNYKEYDFVLPVNGSQYAFAPATYYETNRQIYQGAKSGTAVLARSVCYNANTTSCLTTQPSLPISQIDNYDTYDGIQTTGSTAKYDSYGDLIESDIYDFSSAGRGSLLRKEAWVYGYSIAGLPTTDSVYDGSNNIVGSATYQYDQTAPVQSSGVPQHISVTTPRGNLTTQTVYSSSGTSYSIIRAYEDTGSVVSITTPNGTSSLSYDPTFTYLTFQNFPTPSSGVLLSVSTGFDTTDTGLVTQITDLNTQSVQVTYDAMLRPNKIQYPDGGYATYGFWNPNQVGVYAYQNSTTHSDTEVLSDGYARRSRIAVANGQSANPWYQQDTCYDGNGNLKFKSYVYQGNGWGTGKLCSGTGGDTFTYDVLGRVTGAQHGDGTSVSYSYTGRAKKVVDENGVTRISQADGLGRDTILCEVTSGSGLVNSGSPVSCGADISGTGYLTSYSYSQGTTSITQGAQTRTFQVDWLGRPVKTVEPESGTTTYSYAFNGTGLVVTRSRPQANQTNPAVTTTTTTQYDSVNRIVSISYSDGTPAKTFRYDASSEWGHTLQNPRGRLVNYQTGSGNGTTGSIFSYDAMGRVILESECTPSTCGTGGFTIQAGYDWQGNRTMFADAFGPTYTYSYTVANELGSITSNWNDANHPPNLLSNVSFGPSGPLSWKLGNNLQGVRSYDSLGRVSGGWVCNNSSQPYCTGGTQLYGFSESWQAGRVYQSCDTAINNCFTYGYDGFDRLNSRTASGTPSNYSYTYDRWGNRWQQTLTAGSGGPQPNLSFNTATNQIQDTCSNPPVAGHYCYDAAGNMTSDASHTYAYDAEGNVIQVDGGATATYTYDALNHRVRTSPNSEFIFDPDGRKVSGWDPVNKWETDGYTYWGPSRLSFYGNGSTQFEHQDWTGTERARTDVSGNTAGTYTSLPFGDAYTVASGNDWDVYHFAGLDQDNSADEHSQFREYSNTSGRWFSPDPYPGSYDKANPQSFNRYAYVLNSPLTYVDPSGLDGYYWADGCLYYVYTVVESASDGDFRVDNVQELITCNIDQAGPGAPTPPGGSAGGGGGDSGSQQNKTPWYKTCTAQALGKGLAGASLDAIGILPEGGTVAAAFSLFHGAAGISNGTKILQRVAFGAGIITTAAASKDLSEGLSDGDGLKDPSTIVAGLQVSAGGFGIAKGLIEDIPVAGQAIAAGATVLDLIGTGLEVAKCYHP